MCLVGFHLALAICCIGFVVPWTTVGGRTRTGPGLANLSLSLTELGFETPLRIVGFGWYALPFGALVAWMSLFRHHPPRPGAFTVVVSALMVLISAAFWYLLRRGPLLGPHTGATVTTLGAALMVAFSALGRRHTRE